MKHPKPHFVKHGGKWLACYGNQAKGCTFRMQTVIAEDVNAFVAHCKYLEVLDPQAKTMARAVRGGKFNMSIIAAAWRLLRG